MRDPRNNDLFRKGEDPMMPGGFWMGGVWILPIIMIILLGVVFFVIRPRMSGRGGPWFERRGSDQDSQGIREDGDSETPLEILQKRYARGEITKEEYEEIKRDL
jgi:putative membrane protein